MWRLRACCRLLAVVTLAIAGTASARTAHEDTLFFGRFGKISLYSGTGAPAHVVLFVSGDGGWNKGVVDVARELASASSLVVGVDIVHYLRELRASSEECVYPAADFEALSKFVQKKLDFPTYITPVLVGYSSGATLVYAILVEAPSNTFRGGVSLGFCPDLDLDKPLCRGSGLEWDPGVKGKGVVFRPASRLEVPWIALQGTADQVCDPPSTEEFVRRIVNGEIVLLPKVGHGFSVQKNWMPQFEQAFGRLVENRATQPVAPPEGELNDLPLVEVPATAAAGDSTQARTLGVLLTGDGGFGVTDRGIAQSLAAHGIPVVALNSLHYFWTRRTPDSASADLGRILAHYTAAWKKDRAVVVGYSLGADVLPFMVNRLSPGPRASVRLLVFLGLSGEADFEFHLTDWLGGGKHETSLPVTPELEKLRGSRMLCFYGTHDEDSVCRHLDTALATAFPIPGGHRFGGNYAPIAAAILQALK